MKSRNKVDTIKGVDEHEDFKSKQWEDKNGNPCYNFWDLDATEEKGKEQFRMATDKITPWSIK